MIVVVNKFVPFKGFSGISIWPFLFIRSRKFKEDFLFLNHEKIHLKQQRELLILPFYVWYLLEYVFRYAQTGNSRKAYRLISFEAEAYKNENNLQYLKSRKYWAFLAYL